MVHMMNFVAFASNQAAGRLVNLLESKLSSLEFFFFSKN